MIRGRVIGIVRPTIPTVHLLIILIRLFPRFHTWSGFDMPIAEANRDNDPPPPPPPPLQCFHEDPGLLGFHYDTGFLDSFNDIAAVTEGAWYKGQNVTMDASSGTMWLTPDPRDAASKMVSNIGRLAYRRPIDPLCFQRRSFSTSFSFTIITNGSYGTCGSGMAFFISPSQQAPSGSIAGGLGLDVYRNDTFSPLRPLPPPPAPFFAVEFDIRKSPAYNDSSDSHIGIDLSSLVSSAVRDTDNISLPHLYLYNNYKFIAWIDYDVVTQSIQVRMTNESADDRPADPILELHYNISSLFQSPGPPLYMGFTATNRPRVVCMVGIAVYWWRFSMNNTASHRRIGQHALIALAIGLPLTILLVAVTAFIIFFFVMGRALFKKRTLSCENPPPSLSTDKLFTDPSHLIQITELAATPRHSYKELKAATHGFSESNIIGEGACSTVYQGTLKDGSVVAMKKLKGSLKGTAQADFVTEMVVMSRVRHRNLLCLKGWCCERGQALLVYEYMRCGSLDGYLHRGRDGGKGRLNSRQRRNILIGVAAALEYLHNGLGDCILHRDVKAANVLLTDEYEAVLADFGLSRLVAHDVTPMTMTAVGTPGYVAPEVVYTGHYTEKADVYGFGVLALVVACGRPAVDVELPPEEMRIVDWVWQLCARGDLGAALDPSMLDGDTRAAVELEWRCVLHLALLCCHPSPSSRPSMRQVSQVLAESTILVLPSSKPTYAFVPVPCSAASSDPTSPVSTSAATTAGMGTMTEGRPLLTPR